MIKILIAEDHHIVREGIIALLEKHDEFEIIGQAEDGLKAVKLCKELKPDVLLLDIVGPMSKNNNHLSASPQPIRGLTVAETYNIYKIC